MIVEILSKRKTDTSFQTPPSSKKQTNHEEINSKTDEMPPLKKQTNELVTLTSSEKETDVNNQDLEPPTLSFPKIDIEILK